MKNRMIYSKQIILAAMFCLILASCGQSKTIKNTNDTFIEMEDPTTDTLSDWSNVSKGLHSSFVSIDKKHPKSVNPEIGLLKQHKIQGWKGEMVSAQILLWTAENLSEVQCELENLVSATNTIPISATATRFVRYVMTDEFKEGCGYRKPNDFASSLAPDMLDPIPYMNMEAKTVRPVWITINIPSNTEAGVYSSKIKVQAQGLDVQELELMLEVYDKTLPPACEWTYHLDFWQHPAAVARAQNLELWSEAHFEAMAPLFKMLANAGQKVITTTLNKDPWNHQCFDSYEDMILWTKHEDGSWSYDFTIFDKWVSFMHNLGITEMINCYSIVPWNNELHYKDSATGEMVTVQADPETEIFAEMWTPFLTEFQKHLKTKGWLHKTNIAMDERTPESMNVAIGLLETVAPELGIALADNQNSYKKYAHIREMSVEPTHIVSLEDIDARRKKGLITTYYVCCADEFPNTFTFSEAAEATYAAWFALAHDYDGFLRWSYNSWVENPLTDSRYSAWPAGDTYIVYPEARSSIRFERTIEGIQDVEKIKILKATLELENTNESLIQLKRLNDVIRKFESAKRVDGWNQNLNIAKQYINDLSR